MNQTLAEVFISLGMLCLTLSLVWHRITRIRLDKDNRMLRAGFGKHGGKWFIRVDLWFVGFRLS